MVYAAMATLNYSELQVVVTETGWSSKEDGEGTAIYKDNVIKHVLNRIGTPMKPGVEAATYVYGFFSKYKSNEPSHQSFHTWNLHESSSSNSIVKESCTRFHTWNWHGNSLANSAVKESQVYHNDIAGSGGVTEQVSTVRTWCIAKPWASVDTLQAALDWACGPGGADCEPIQLSEPCFVPNSVLAHASYAFNSYYQIHQHAGGTCDFGGTATIVDEDPSYPGCIYPFRSGQVGAPVDGGNMNGSHVEFAVAMSFILVVLHLVSSNVLVKCVLLHIGT
eukprot:c654_g1_i2 orf=471-1304(+)